MEVEQGHRDERKLDDKSGDDRRDQSANEPGRKTFVAPLEVPARPAGRMERDDKLIWKLGPTAPLGRKISTMSAPDATSRKLMASRPSAMPARTSSAATQLRTVGTCAPVRSV